MHSTPTRRISRGFFAAAAVGALLAGVSPAYAQQPSGAPEPAPRYEPAMIEELAESLGVSEQAAVERLDDEAEQQQRLQRLAKDGVSTDGAFFTESGRLTVNVPDADAAAEVRDAKLKARVPQRGKAELERITAELDAAAERRAPAGVVSWSADLASDTVTVEVRDADAPGTAAFLKTARKHGEAIRIQTGAERVETQTDVYPGSRMYLGNTGSWCSVGFGATDSSGTEYLVTAGHCVEGMPSLQYDGSRFAVGSHTRFHTHQQSVDMGVARVDHGYSIAPYVGTWGNTDNVAVEGSRRAPVGSTVCKSGSTTGWTCGEIERYDVTVNYVDKGDSSKTTTVSGLGLSTVCTEGGDSGGAYISGNQAQGMTSGGPVGQQCGGVHYEGSSYFQPLDDALSYYDLRLTTS